MENIDMWLFKSIIVLTCVSGAIAGVAVIVAALRNTALVNPARGSFVYRYLGYGWALKIKLICAGMGLIGGFSLALYAFLFKV